MTRSDRRLPVRSSILFALVCVLAIAAIAALPAQQAGAPGVRVAVVLGNGPQAIDEPTPVQTARCLKALELYKTGAVNKLLVTGGFTFGYISEARMMKIALVTYGVPPEDVVEDQMAATTIENALFAARIFDERGWKKSAVVVSQKFHLARADGIFKNDGFEVQEGVAAEAATRPEDFAQVPDLKHEPVPKGEASDAIVVYEPFRSLEPMDWPTAALARRLRAAAALYHAGGATSLVLFNDLYTRGPVNLAQMMKVGMLSLGVPASNVKAAGRKEYRRLADLATALGDRSVTLVAPASVKDSLGLDPARRWKTVFVD